MKPATGNTICIVLERYVEWLQQQPKLRDHVARELNNHLDTMRAHNHFGTDGRQDPRGA